MEKNWFEWKEWEELDTGIIQFLQCTLIEPLADFGIGEEFSEIVIDYTRGIIQFFRGNSVGAFKLELKLGVKL